MTPALLPPEEKPKRVQLSRKKGWRMPESTVKVDRRTAWGNPYLPPTNDRAGLSFAIEHFRAYAEEVSGANADWLAPLRGKNLACWCPLDRPCHADVLLEIANG